jgi:Kef-type K+ transport system membrane component KefB
MLMSRLTVFIALFCFGVSLFVISKVIRHGNRQRLNLFLKASLVGYALFICLLFSAVASLLKVNFVLGVLLAGLTVGTLPEDWSKAVKDHIKEFAMAFFVSLYFAGVGLKLDLVRHFAPWVFLGFLIFCFFVKTARVFWGPSWHVGIGKTV